MAGSPEDSAPTAPRPRPPFAALLFGYDVFISFALGGPPRGSRSYASDLARRLRERDYAVFFSEDEAPAGGQLDGTLKTALARSRILVVIANRGTLADPRWVRVEVEEFRRRHPDRTVITINIGGALQDPALGPAAHAWLPWGDRIWIDDTQEACDHGVVGEPAIERLLTAPTAVRTGTRWRWMVRGAFTTLAMLTAAAVWFALADRRNARLAQHNEQVAQTNEIRATENARTAQRNEVRAAANAASAASEAARAQRAEGEAVREAEEARAAERRARAGELAARGQLERESDAARALLLAREAWQTAPLPDARRALYEALSEPVALALDPRLDDVRRAAYSPDGRHIAAASSAARFALLRTDVEAPPIVGSAGATLRGLAFSPDSKLLATLNSNAHLQLWNAETGTPLGGAVSLPGLRHGWALAWCPDGSQLALAGEATSSDAQAVVFWDPLARREAAPPLPVVSGLAIASLDYSPDGKRLALTAGDRIEVWNLAQRTLVVPKIATRSGTTFVAFTSDVGIVFDGPGYEATAWSLWDNRVDPLTYGGHTNWVVSFAQSATGGIAATGSEDGTIRLWQADAAQPLGSPLVGHVFGVSSLQFNGDGSELVSAGRDGRLLRWLLPTDARRLRKTAPTDDPARDGADVTRSSALRWTVRLLRASRRVEWLHEGRSQAAGPLPGSPDEGIAVAPDGTLALRGADDSVGLIAVGRAQARCSLGKPARGARFSLDGHRLFTWFDIDKDPALRIWNAADCRAAGVLERSESDALEFGVDWSADSRGLWVATPQGLRRWDVARNAFVGAAWPLPRTQVVFTDPLGRYVAGSLPAGGIRLFDVRRGGAATDLLGAHGNESVLALAFSADGAWLASAANSGHALWDLATGQRAGRTIRNRLGQLRGIAFSADSRTLMTTATDGREQLWQLDPEVWATQACTVAHRNLTCGEWRRLMGDASSYRRTCAQWPLPPDAAACVR